MKGKRRPANRLLLLIGLFAVAALLSVGIYIFRTVQYEDWLPAQGVLTDAQQYYGGGGGRRIGHGRSYRVFYTYTVEGKTYAGSEMFSGNVPDHLAVGEAVEVWYDPDSPDKTSFGRPTPGLDPYGPLILALPLALFIVGGTGRLGGRRLSHEGE